MKKTNELLLFDKSKANKSPARYNKIQRLRDWGKGYEESLPKVISFIKDIRYK